MHCLHIGKARRLQRSDSWTEKQCKVLKDILSRYTKFKASPVISRLREYEVTHDNYARVDLVGYAADADRALEQAQGRVGAVATSRERMSTSAVDADDGTADAEDEAADADDESARAVANAVDYNIQAAFVLQCMLAG